MNDDRELFARFLVVILARPELNLQECIGEFEFAVFPRSLFALDGTMRSCAVKSKLMDILESLVVEPPPTDNQPNSVAGQVTIIDGMAVVQAMGKPTWVRTGKDLAKHFLNVVEQTSTGFDEVHVIFDRYDIANSLKERTQQLRYGDQRSISYHISDDAVIEKTTLKQLLGSNTFKEKLSHYLAAQLLTEHGNADRVYVTIINEETKSNKLPVTHLNSSQEEADTRMLLHAYFAAKRGARSVCIQSPDTDVLVIALWCVPDLCSDISMLVGTGSKRQIINLRSIYESLQPEQVSALPGFHAFSGCDQTGTFCRKPKLSCWNAFQKADAEVQRALGKLGTIEQIQESDYAALEQFTCQIYAPGTRLTRIKDLRWFLFGKRQFTGEKLPPTKTALVQMIDRSNYVALIWKQCVVASHALPDPKRHGWYQDGAQLVPTPTTALPALQSILELVKCRCKGNCTSRTCSCRKHDLRCTDVCSLCNKTCENRNLNVMTEDDDDDEDNDESLSL